MIATLTRWANTPFGSFATMLIQDEVGHSIATFCTAEEDWRGNVPLVSCIPAGRYLCKRFSSLKHGETFEVTGVPNRSAILIHSGNTEEDTEGCILLGEKFGCLTVSDEDQPTKPMTAKWAVVQSKEAFARFQQVMQGESSFWLTIKWQGNPEQVVIV